MSPADQRYQEKIRARAEGRAPAVRAPIVVPAGASPDERYLAKLAARANPQPAPAAATEPPKADAAPKAKAAEPKPEASPAKK